MATFGTLSDRLTETFRNLRTKGKLTPADVDGTVREACTELWVAVSILGAAIERDLDGLWLAARVVRRSIATGRARTATATGWRRFSSTCPSSRYIL